MKKKISILGLAFMLVLGLAGCGSQTDNEAEYDQAYMEECADAIVMNFYSMSDEEFSSFETMSDYELNFRLMSSGLPIAADDFRGMLEAWQAGISDMGAYTEFGAYVMETSGTGATLTADLVGTQKSGEIMFSFDENMNLESITIDPTYEMSEILTKAGLNTLLGMGTVFAVLIFISFIISLFKFIPAIEERFRNKKDKKAETPAPKADPAERQMNTVVPAPAKSEPVSVAAGGEAVDDGELIAVIAVAIAAAEGTSTDGFFVRSIKRRKSNKWN